jgi:hypothetical protein
MLHAAICENGTACGKKIEPWSIHLDAREDVCRIIT